MHPEALPLFGLDFDCNGASTLASFEFIFSVGVKKVQEYFIESALKSIHCNGSEEIVLASSL